MSMQRKLWIGLAVLLAVSFAALLWVGGEIHRVMPPIPTAVVTAEGRDDLHARRHRERPAGLAVDRRPAARLDLGTRQLCRAGLDGRLAASRSARVARHRRAARDSRRTRTAASGRMQQAALAARLQPRIRANTYDDAQRHASPSRPIAPRRSQRSQQHYTALFGDDPSCSSCARRTR